MIRLCLLSLMHADCIQVTPSVVVQDNTRTLHEMEVASALRGLPRFQDLAKQNWQPVNRVLGAIDTLGTARINGYCLTDTGGVIWKIDMPSALGEMYLFSYKERAKVAGGITAAEHVQLVHQEFLDLILEWVASKTGQPRHYKHLALSENFKQVIEVLREKYGDDQLGVYFNNIDGAGRIQCIVAKLADLEQRYYGHNDRPSQPSTYDDVSEKSTLAYVEENESEDSEQQYPVFLPRIERYPPFNTTQAEPTLVQPMRTTIVHTGAPPTPHINEEDPEEQTRRNARRAAQQRGALSREDREARQRINALENQNINIAEAFVAGILPAPSIIVEDIRMAVAQGRWDDVTTTYWNHHSTTDQQRNDTLKLAVMALSNTARYNSANIERFILDHIHDPTITENTRIEIYRDLMALQVRGVNQPVIQELRSYISEEIRRQHGDLDPIEDENEILNEHAFWMTVPNRRNTELEMRGRIDILNANLANLRREKERRAREREHMNVAVSPAAEVHSYALTQVESTDNAGKTRLVTTKDAILIAISKHVQNERYVISSYDRVKEEINAALQRLLRQELEEEKKTKAYQGMPQDKQENRLADLVQLFHQNQRQLYRNIAIELDDGRIVEDLAGQNKLRVMWAWVTNKHPNSVDVWLKLWLEESTRAHGNENGSSCTQGFNERMATAARGLGDQEIAEVVKPAEELLYIKMKLKNLGDNPNLPEYRDRWIKLLAQLGGANNLEEAKQEVEIWWNNEKKWVDDNKEKYGNCDQTWIKNMDGKAVASILDQLEESKLSGFISEINAQVEKELAAQEPSTPQIDPQLTEIRRQQHEKYKNQQPPVVAQATPQFQHPTQNPPTFYNVSLFYTDTELIDLGALDHVYALYKSLDITQPFDEWMDKNVLTNGSINPLLAEYTHIPHHERAVCTFYEFLLLQAAVIEDQENGRTKVISVGLDLIDRLAQHWQVVGNGASFDQWLDDFIAPNRNILPVLNKVRIAYEGKISVQSACTFYDFLLFYAAFQWEDPSAAGKIRVDFTVLERLFARWTANQPGISTLKFENWLEALSVFDDNICKTFTKHWMEYYKGYYKAKFSNDSFIDFLKYQKHYETNRTEQVEWDRLYAEYLRNQT